MGTYETEYEVDKLRPIRNQKLSETDKYCLVDWPQTAEEKETRLKYRQQLRNLPQLYLEKWSVIILFRAKFCM